MKVLGLDLGTNAGWAFSNSGVMTSGVINLGNKKRPGEKYAALMKFLLDNYGEKNALDLIVYEKPHMRGFAATSQLLGMAAVVELFAECAEIPMKTVHTGTLKKFATGSGKAEKKDMISAAKKAWRIKSALNDNEADALWVCCWGIHNAEKE